MANTPRLWVPSQGRGRNTVKNAHGKTLPCCYHDCGRNGDKTITIEVPHPTPRWVDPVSGTQEMLIYIFCTNEHRYLFAKGTPYERYVN